MLILENVTKSYKDIKILRGVDLSVQKGEIVSIVGSSGAGKSTLLHIMGTLDKPDNGKVQIAGESPFSMKEKDLAIFRNKSIGFVFQFHNLLPEFNALENICMPGFIGKKKQSDVVKKAKELLEILGLKDKAYQKPSQMSGGEQQRTSVARALINEPSIIFADEPSGNLDSSNANELHQLFFDLRNQLNCTFVIVTHNKELSNLADRKLEMKDGLLI